MHSDLHSRRLSRRRSARRRKPPGRPRLNVLQQRKLAKKLRQGASRLKKRLPLERLRRKLGVKSLLEKELSRQRERPLKRRLRGKSRRR